MLYWILYPLRETVSFFNLFGYITFRAAGATFTAMLVAFAAGPLVIRFLTGRAHISARRVLPPWEGC